MRGSLGEDEAPLSTHSICKKLPRNFMADLPFDYHNATLPIGAEPFIEGACANGLLLDVSSGLGLKAETQG